MSDIFRIFWDVAIAISNNILSIRMLNGISSSISISLAIAIADSSISILNSMLN